MRLALAVASILCAAAPTAAAEWITCSGEGADISILVGSLPVLGISRANFSVGDETWSTHPDIEPGKLIALGQGFETPQTLTVDLTDENLESVVAELRVFKAEEGDAYAQGGTLRVPGKGAWAVSCTGP